MARHEYNSPPDLQDRECTGKKLQRRKAKRKEELYEISRELKDAPGNLKQSGYVAEEDELEYPKLRNFLTNVAKSGSVVSNYVPPREPVMGPINYPPASGEAESSGTKDDPYSQGYLRRRSKSIRDGLGVNMWTLPSAQQQTGAMLILPLDIGKWDDVITRWESITLNHVDDPNKVWNSNRQKIAYIENLMGEVEKITWIQWRMTYKTEYEQLEEMADDTQNVLSQVRRVFLLQDPYQGSTEAQNRAYNALERLICKQPKDIPNFLNDYKDLATRTGRLYISSELSDKLFRKLPPPFDKEIEEKWNEKYPGSAFSVLPRIYFTMQYLTEVCRKAAVLKAVKDLSFCESIPIPGYYGEKKKYGLRKSKTYKGKPHDTHVRIFKKKQANRERKCKCFICGEEGHFARECKSKKGNIARAAVLDELKLPLDWDILSVDQNEPESDHICSLSEGEGDFVSKTLEEELYETVFMMESSWRPWIKLPEAQENCEHVLNEEFDVIAKCDYCKEFTKKGRRVICDNCAVIACALCARFYLNHKVSINKKRTEVHHETKDKLIEQLSLYNAQLIEENEDLRAENTLLKQQVTGLMHQLKLLPEKLKEPLLEEVAESDYQQEFPPLRRSNFPALFTDEVAKTTEERIPTYKKNNKLYNILIKFIIPGIPEFKLRAVLDTGATSCCANIHSVPNEAIEESAYPISITGINSANKATHKIKNGVMEIEGSRFRIPFTYVFQMETASGIEMLVGCNFIRAMNGGIRIEDNVVTFYKNVTSITTQPVLMTKILEEFEEDYYINSREEVLVGLDHTSPRFKQRFGGLLKELEEQGFIGNDPIKHWAKNQVQCDLDIINPDITIQDKPLKHVTPAMKEQFQRHLKALLDLKVIRPSKSRHRTMAMIVHSGSSIDPTTGKEIKGKERMVFNYRTLNDNTYKDQYSLPGINTIIQQVGSSSIYSKFDLKSGFHQVLMKEESIPWTAFITPDGLYEWLVMPFGLKNAPAVFQRKMDNCFRGCEEFLAVYIDDILVFSNNEEQHAKHLEQMLTICRKEGLILSANKMRIAVPEIEFLGVILGNQKIRLQPHIIKKIIEVKEENLKEKKGLRSWLGILNYARNFIPKLGLLLGPLYQKTSPHGDKRMKESDWEIVNRIKHLVQNLPAMKLPPKECFIILETDGCMDGWGAICKWKLKEKDPRNEENICAYNSGRFPNSKSTIDAEIHAVMEGLNSFKIYYLDKKKVLIRTDCQAIISFYNKSNNHKPSRVRWLNFIDFITGSGVEVQFEHIDGKQNVLADVLSRLTVKLCQQEWMADTEEWEEKYQQAGEAFIELCNYKKLGYNSYSEEQELVKAVTIWLQDEGGSNIMNNTSPHCLLLQDSPGVRKQNGIMNLQDLYKPNSVVPKAKSEFYKVLLSFRKKLEPMRTVNLALITSPDWSKPKPMWPQPNKPWIILRKESIEPKQPKVRILEEEDVSTDDKKIKTQALTTGSTQWNHELFRDFNYMPHSHQQLCLRLDSQGIFSTLTTRQITGKMGQRQLFKYGPFYFKR